jgi:5-azacytidine-induced protein 1
MVLIKNKVMLIYLTIHIQLTDKMHKERDRVSDIIRQEFADRLVFTDEENKRIKTEISELKARQRIELDKAKDEIENIKHQKDEEMEEVHKR